ncbi:MAG: N-acetyltransferase [Oscillospiraceae bacterium]|nr:N-acetyltransferase [Oscillospiraceae bacterium]
MIIRPETEKDHAEVENLTREAFWNVYQPGCCEHLVVHRLRKDPAFLPGLDYVIEEDDGIVAHIMYARAFVEGEDGVRHEIAIFGPVSVRPDRQGQGLGSKLITFTLQKAAEMGIPLVAITGNPDYYHRFGFETAALHGIRYGTLPEGEDAPFFMVKLLDPQKAAAIRGVYSDPEVYLVTEEETEAFDRHFPPKVKEVRKGQLR